MDEKEIQALHNKIIDRLFLCKGNAKAFIKMMNTEAEIGYKADMLEAMGHIEIPSIREPIREILEYHLMSSSEWVRDGAVRGLSYLDNPKSWKELKSAYWRETNPRLKEYIRKVMTHLEEHADFK